MERSPVRTLGAIYVVSLLFDILPDIFLPPGMYGSFAGWFALQYMRYQIERCEPSYGLALVMRAFSEDPERELVFENGTFSQKN